MKRRQQTHLFARRRVERKRALQRRERRRFAASQLGRGAPVQNRAGARRSSPARRKRSFCFGLTDINISAQVRFHNRSRETQSLRLIHSVRTKSSHNCIVYKMIETVKYTGAYHAADLKPVVSRIFILFSLLPCQTQSI